MGDGVGAHQLPAEAWLAALAGLPDVGPARLAALVGGGDPAAAWTGLASGRSRRDPQLLRALGSRGGPLLHRWCTAAAAIDVSEVWAAHRRAGIRVLGPASPDWPERLVGDPHAPAVLFCRGDLAALGATSVAVVGTRACTAYGRSVAAGLGRDLATAGVDVVSGLALGIDGAAHRGVLEARRDADGTGGRPVGVVGSGLDVAYPRRHQRLWAEVAEAGLLVGEHPLGVAPAPWRFPARNRIIAALASVTVVVESHEVGGSLGTALEAAERGRVVLAVPGPVGSGASSGANALLADGAGVCRGADDVLDALGLLGGRAGAAAPDRTREAVAVSAAARTVLDALGWRPASLEEVALRLADEGTSLAGVAAALDELQASGLVAERGGWFERTDGGP